MFTTHVDLCWKKIWGKMKSNGPETQKGAKLYSDLLLASKRESLVLLVLRQKETLRNNSGKLIYATRTRPDTATTKKKKPS